MPTYDQHMKALQRAREAGDMEAVEIIRGEATKAMQAEEAAKRDAEERARPLAQRVMTNIGAGMTNLWQGARDVAGDMGIGKGVSDEEIKEKRAIDDKLASQTTGGGLIQVAGEILPTLVVPMGSGAAAARGVASLAGRTLPQAAARAGLGRAALSSAAGGAAGAGLQATTSDESRANNMLVGAAAGGAAPYLLKGAMAAGRAAGRGVQNIAAGAGSTRAAEAVGKREMADTLTRAGLDEGKLTTQYKPHTLVETKPSAAVAAQDEKLAMLERASRADNPAAWAPVDEANQAARWRALDDNLLTQADLDARLAHANEVGAAAPYAAAGKQRFNAAMDDFYAKLQQAKSTAEYHGNPAVRAAVDAVEGSMRDAGNVTPALMHQLRQTLGKGLTGVPGAGEQGVRAATKDPKVLGLMQGIDDVMEYATKGKWGQWKDAYGSAMDKAGQAKADINVRGHFVDDFGNPRFGTSDVPQVTGRQLQRAMERFGVGKKGPKAGDNLLSFGSEDLLRGVKGDLDANDILQRVKRSGTSGGGSDTVMNAGNIAKTVGLEAMLPGSGALRLMGQQGKQKGREAAAEQLARLLQGSPEEVRAVLQAIAQQRALRGTLPAALPGGAGFALGGMLASD